MFLVASCSFLCPIHWSQMLSWERRCSWSSADRRCSNYIWVINNFIAYLGVTYIRGLTIFAPMKPFSSKFVLLWSMSSPFADYIIRTLAWLCLWRWSLHVICYYSYVNYCVPTYWRLNKMVDIWQKIVLNAFSSMIVIVFWSIFHWFDP